MCRGAEPGGEVDVAELINDLARHAASRDLRIKEPDIEGMIKHIYTNAAVMEVVSS